jgi:hypothetical protein
MEAAGSSETSVTIYQSTVPEDLNLLEHALSNVTVKCIEFLLHIQEIRGSNLGPQIIYTN